MLNDLFKQLKQEELEKLNLFVCDETFPRYFCTPEQGVPIAHIGVDGIHFCSYVLDKAKPEENPVVVVSSYSAPNVIPVARNDQEFLNLLISCGELGALEVAALRPRSEFEEYMRGRDKYLEENPDSAAQVERVINALKELTGCEEIADPYDYVQQVKEGFPELIEYISMDESWEQLTQLTEEQVADIEKYLREVRKGTNLVYKIDPGVVSTIPQSWLRHIVTTNQDDAITGYATIAYFDGSNVETTLIGRPDQLFELVLPVAKQLGGQNMLIIVSRGDKRLEGYVKSMEIPYSFSEYRMEYHAGETALAPGRSLVLRPAVSADLPFMTALEAAAFEEAFSTEEEVARTIVAEIDGVPVSKMRIDEQEGVYGLYGFVVLPELQGTGIGTEFMRQVLADIREKGYQKILLEVAADNPKALRVYERVGFQVVGAFDYYKYPLQ